MIMKSFLIIVLLTNLSLQSAVKIDCEACYLLKGHEVNAKSCAVLGNDELLIMEKMLNNEQKATVKAKLLKEESEAATILFAVQVNDELVSQPCLVIKYGQEATISIGTKDSFGEHSELFKISCNAVVVEN